MHHPTCVLVTAGPAAGKTCLMSQLVMHVVLRGSYDEGESFSAKASEWTPAPDDLVPILIRVQDLQRKLLANSEGAFSSSWNWADAYLRVVHGVNSELYRFLRQALMARRALLLLDGIDEAGKAREAIERHVSEVLAPQATCSSSPRARTASRPMSRPPATTTSSCARSPTHSKRTWSSDASTRRATSSAPSEPAR